MPTYKSISSRRADYGSQFEILVSLLYHRLMDEGSTAIDGGANAGLHAVPMAAKVGRGHLHCFEPNPAMVLDLSRNLAGAGVLNCCSIHAQALGESSGTVEFLVNDETPALSHIRYEGETKLRSTRVPVVTIDDVLGGNNVSFVKLDLEGSDFLALRGARSTLRRSKPIVVFENSRQWAAECYGYSSQQFFEFFEDIGYSVYDLHGRPLARETWHEEDLAFEFFCGSTNDIRLQIARELVEQFWTSVDGRPELQTWRECVLIARDPMKYLSEHGWK